MAEEDHYDIYGDLSDFDASVKLKETTVELEALKETHKEIVKQLEAAEAVNKHTKALNVTIKKNFFILQNTARAEVQRKDRTIAEMRENMDNMAFRRNRKRATKYTQTENVQENGRRKNSNDRYRSFNNDDTYRKRRPVREKSRDPKRRRRSASRERNYKKEEKSYRKSREKSQKKDVREKSQEMERTHNVKEDEMKPKCIQDGKEVHQETIPQKNERIYQEESQEINEAVQNLLQLADKVPPPLVEPQDPSPLSPQESPEITPDPTTSPLNRSINLGKTIYTMGQNSRGIVTVAIKRKKRKNIK